MVIFKSNKSKVRFTYLYLKTERAATRCESAAQTGREVVSKQGREGERADRHSIAASRPADLRTAWTVSVGDTSRLPLEEVC